MRSQRQRRYLHAQKPEVAKKFEEKTSSNAKLPEKKKSSGDSSKKKSSGSKSSGKSGKKKGS